MAKGAKGSKLREWQARVNNGGGVCAKCARTDHLTVDHIVPVALLELFRIPKEEQHEDEENFQVLCRWCNSFKGFSLDHLNPKTAILLKRYVDEFISHCA